MASRTGDLADRRRRLRLDRGSAGDLINRGGNKVFPHEVEEVLRSVAGVADVAVFAVDERLGEVPVAAIVGTSTTKSSTPPFEPTLLPTRRPPCTTTTAPPAPRSARSSGAVLPRSWHDRARPRGRHRTHDGEHLSRRTSGDSASRSIAYSSSHRARCTASTTVRRCSRSSSRPRHPTTPMATDGAAPVDFDMPPSTSPTSQQRRSRPSTPAHPCSPRDTTSARCRLALLTDPDGNVRRSSRRSEMTIEIHHDGPVGWLIFDRPDVGNAIDAQCSSTSSTRGPNSMRTTPSR